MNLLKIKKIVDIIYYVAIGFSVIVIGKNFYDQQSLPEGVCPINNNYNLIVSAIVILVFAFVVSTIIDRKVKRQTVDDEVTKEDK